MDRINENLHGSNFFGEVSDRVAIDFGNWMDNDFGRANPDRILENYYPDKLLAIYEIRSIKRCNRVYFSPIQSSPGKTPFEEVSYISFKKDDNDRWILRDVEKKAEVGKDAHAVGSYNRVSFLTLKDHPLDSVHAQIGEPGRGGLRFRYDRESKLNGIEFDTPQPGELEADTYVVPLTALGGTKAIRTQVGPNIFFESSRSEDGNHIELKRIYKNTEEEKILDEIKIPVDFDETQIREQLVSPEFLEDPLSAPPEEDETWKKANLGKLLGVEWKAHSQKQARNREELLEELKEDK